ncbi:hypothetical protein KAJ27_16600 [bacterium]|nr:hypothetical protein [bacterium]
MKITTKQITDISQDLQMGLKTFINKETYEVRSLLDPGDRYVDPEVWEDSLNVIEKEWNDYFCLTKMDSWESFKIMEDFIEEINDERLKNDLVKILNMKKPFANFKAEIDISLYRQKWLDFCDMKYEEYVREILKSEEINVE